MPPLPPAAGRHPKTLNDSGRSRGYGGTAGVDPKPTFVSLPADRWGYRGAVIRTTRLSSSRQLVEQRFRLFQVGGVEALGEPGVDRGEQVAGFGAAARTHLAAARTHRESYCEDYLAAEIDRVYALLLKCEQAPTETVEQCLTNSLRTARRQEARLLELRAATSLARLWGEQGRRAEARELLAHVYDWFTEGFETADLKDAKRLLDELA